MVIDGDRQVIPPPTGPALDATLERIHDRLAADLDRVARRRYRQRTIWIGAGAGLLGIAAGTVITGAALSPRLQIAASSALDVFSATCHTSIDPAADDPVRNVVQRAGQRGGALADQVLAARMTVVADCARSLRGVALTTAYESVAADYGRRGYDCGSAQFIGGGGVIWQPGSDANGRPVGMSVVMWPPATTPARVSLPSGCRTFTDVPAPSVTTTPTSLVACSVSENAIDVYPGAEDRRTEICAAKGELPYGGGAPVG